LRVEHYSIRTEQAYVDWIRRYILFHRKRYPSEMGEGEITEFLTHLAVEKHVAASTQNQAFAALLFLYQQVIERKLDFIDNVQRVTRPAKLPVVLTPSEARAVPAHLKSEYRLMAELLYGSGLRLMETASQFCRNVCVDLSRCTLSVCRKFISTTCARVAVALTCPSPWNANTGTPIAPGHGSTLFQPPNFPPIRARSKLGAIMFRRKICKKQSKLPSNGRESVRLQVATRWPQFCYSSVGKRV
jgi:hypothetical protein